MTATNPLPLRTRDDDNLYSDINSIQEQIGDLSLLNITNFQDYDEETQGTTANSDANRDLTTAFEELRNKILSSPNTYTIIAGIINEGGGNITISLNEAVFSKDGIPIGAGDKIIISETGVTEYDTQNLDDPYSVVSVNNESSPTELTITKAGGITFNGDLSDKIPIGIVTFLDGKGGKIIQNGAELLPAGAIVMIIGEYPGDPAKGYSINESNSPLAGIDVCPDGYIACDNSSQIDDSNSIFDNHYSPDMKSLFVKGKIDSLGAVQESDFHNHGLNGHYHSFEHYHHHSHSDFNHYHSIDAHDHNANHTHEIGDHIHFISIESNRDHAKDTLTSILNRSSEERDHKHHLSGSTGAIVRSGSYWGGDDSVTKTDAPGTQSGDKSITLSYGNPLNDDMYDLAQNLLTSFETETEEDNEFTNWNLNINRFKAVTFCMKK